MTYEVSQEIMDAIDDFLNRDNWHFEKFEEKGSFKTLVRLRNRMRSAEIFIHVDNDSFAVRVISPISPDENSEDIARVNEFVTRANYGMRRGCFDMDLDTGKVIFRTSQFCGNVAPREDEITETIYFGAIMMERYGDALLKVIYGFSTPQDAIEEVENVRR